MGLTIPLYSTSRLVGGEWEGEGEGEEEGEGREGRDCVLYMRWSYTVHNTCSSGGRALTA